MRPLLIGRSTLLQTVVGLASSGAPAINDLLQRVDFGCEVLKIQLAFRPCSSGCESRVDSDRLRIIKHANRCHRSDD